MRRERLRAAVGFFLGHQFQVVAVTAADDFADDIVRVGGDGGERDRLRRRAFDADLLVDDLEIVRACFQFTRGHLENLIARVDGCEPRRAARNQDAPAADRACVPWTGVGVDINHGDIAYWNAELFGDDHGNTEAGNGAHVDLADVHGHRAVFIHFYDRAAAGTGALDP